MKSLIKKLDFRVSLSVVLLVMIFSSGCKLLGIQPDTVSSANSANKQPIHSKITPVPSPSSTSTTNIDLSKVDFANFTYPWTDGLGNPNKKFTLVNRELKETNDNVGLDLYSVVYGDVTNDGVEEALVVLSVYTGGTAHPHVVYIYRTNNHLPHLLWGFNTGDRGDGGLRQIWSENGELVIDLYGKDRVIGKDLYKADDFQSHPDWFTRAHYKWNGKRFQQQGKEVLKNPSGSGSPIMPIFKFS